MDTSTGCQQIVTAARIEVDRMRSCVAQKNDAADVRMSASQFRTLAKLIESLADHCAITGRDPECWLEDVDGQSDDVRAWVPLHYLSAERQARHCLKAEVAEARAQLSVREADYLSLTALAFGLQSRATGRRR